MEITLNDERTSMWGLQDSEIFLTFSNPGPVKIDWDVLSVKQQIALNAAVLQKQVFVDQDLPAIDTPPQEEKSGGDSQSPPFQGKSTLDGATASTVQTMAADIATLEANKMAENKRLEKEAKSLLRKHAGTIKTTLENANADHLKLVQTMIKLEQEKKRSRVKILKILNDNLIRVQNETAQKITENIEGTEAQKDYVDPNKVPKGIEITDDYVDTGERITFNPKTGEITKEARIG